MKLSQRERVMALVGGGMALATVLVTWVLGPTWSRWSEMGDELAPKMERLSVLRERAAGQDALLAERTRLVRELGVLCPAPPRGAEEGQRAAGRRAHPQAGHRSPSRSASRPSWPSSSAATAGASS